MTKLKLRIFDIDNKNMIYINDLFFFEEEGISKSGDKGFCTTYSPVMLGMDDFEYYEEDIVFDGGSTKGIVKHGSYIYTEDEGSEITLNGWYIESLDLFNKGTCDVWMTHLLAEGDLEVIGNTFEEK